MILKKQILFFAFLMLLAAIVSATTIPNSFIISGNMTATQKAFYIKSIEAADMEQFRLQQQNVVLKFKNGFVIELLSAKELVVKGIAPNLDINLYVRGYVNPNYRPPLFEILSSGQLSAEIQNQTPSK
jgi:hypothetical protein